MIIFKIIMLIPVILFYGFFYFHKGGKPLNEKATTKEEKNYLDFLELNAWLSPMIIYVCIISE